MNTYNHSWLANNNNQKGIANFCSDTNTPIKLQSFKDFQYITNMIDHITKEAYHKGQQSILNLVKNHIE